MTAGRVITQSAAGFYMLQAEWQPGWTRKSREPVVAQDPSELHDLWSALALEGEPPTVDFGTHLVLGFRRPDDCLQTRLRGLVLTPLGHLRILRRKHSGTWACTVTRRESVLAFAVARAALPPTFKFTSPAGSTLRIEQRMPESRTPVEWHASDPPPTSARALGHVTTPIPGEPVLARLDDGSPVWAVAHDDGTFDVFDALEDMPQWCGVTGVRQILAYAPKSRLFNAEWDEYGVNTHAVRRNLERYAVNRDSDALELEVGQRVPPSRRTVALPASGPLSYEPAPELDGAAISLEEAQVKPEGSVLLLDAALVIGPKGPRLCKVDPKAPRRECPDGSPVPDGVISSRQTHVLGVLGPPVLARVNGGRFSDVVRVGTQFTCQFGYVVAEPDEASTAADAPPRSATPRKQRHHSWSGTLGGYLTALYQDSHVLPFGGEAKFGFEYDFEASRNAELADHVLETLVGDNVGAALRARAVTGSVDERNAVVATLSLAARITNEVGRFEVPTLLTPLAPEAGVLVRSPGSAGFFLGASAPIGYAQYELLPSLVWLPIQGDALFTLSLGVTME